MSTLKIVTIFAVRVSSTKSKCFKAFLVTFVKRGPNFQLESPQHCRLCFVKQEAQGLESKVGFLGQLDAN